MASFHFEIKSGKRGTAAEHARYVSREGKHKRRGDLIDTTYGNLPAWAEGQPEKFWQAADKYERINGAAYRELVIAIPNELNREQARSFADRIVTDVIGDKPYQYALHAPDASLGNTTNTHVHVMYSDRMADDIDRPPEKTFSRYNRKHPEQGGRKKDSGGKNRMQLRDDVIARRKAVADIENQMLQEAGHDARVDHRSHRERGIDKQPERHLGPAKIRGMSTEDKSVYTASRQRHLAEPHATLPQKSHE